MENLTHCEHLLTGVANALGDLIDSLDSIGISESYPDDAVEEAMIQAKHMFAVYLRKLDEEQD